MRQLRSGIQKSRDMTVASSSLLPRRGIQALTRSTISLNALAASSISHASRPAFFDFAYAKAIDEAESEWSQHNAKRLIDTRIKGLRSSVPKNFPYFHVEFGMNGGYAHVIDDESKFTPEFGRAVLEGMLEIEQEDFHMQTLSKRDQVKFANDFAKMWEPHDWTKMLE